MTSMRLCILCSLVAALLTLMLLLAGAAERNKAYAGGAGAGASGWYCQEAAGPPMGQVDPKALRDLLSFAADPPRPVSFLDDVGPLLRENCFACHNGKVKKGNFDMTTFAGLLKGGDKGETVSPGEPEQSNLWLVMSGELQPHMPPKEAGGLLPKEKIAVVERWIKEGARFDGPAKDADLAMEIRKRWRPPAPPARYRFPAIVNALAFTPDQKKIVTGGHHELLVWNAAEGTLEKRIRTRAERAMAMVFLPDGKTLAVAGGRPGQEGELRLYDLDGGKPQQEAGVAYYDGVDPKGGIFLRELVQTDDQLLCLAVHAEARLLAAAGCDKIIRVWSIADDFKLLDAFENHSDWVHDLAFTPDGRRLLSASRDKTAKTYDLEDKKNIQNVADHQNEVYAVAVRPDGRVALSGGKDNQVRWWNVGGGGRPPRNPANLGDAVWRILCHPSRNLVFVACADKTVRVLNADNGQLVRTLAGHADQVYSLALSGDGRLLASGGYDGEVRIWKTEDGSLVKSFTAAPGVEK